MPKRILAKGFRIYTPTGIFLLLLFLGNSCLTPKKVTYFNDLSKTEPEFFNNIYQPEYRLQRQDILYIRFFTLNTEINELLNGGNESTNQSLMYSTEGAYFNGYTISDSGNIIIPLIGEVPVLGKTMEQATDAIEQKASEYIKEATVNVKLMVFKYTILGEVKSPGSFRLYNSRITLPEALGMAGDITEFGNRSNILIIRPLDTGFKSIRVNLSKKELLTSEQLYILPNDIIIVEPLSLRFIRSNTQNFYVILSTTASVISLFVLISSKL